MKPQKKPDLPAFTLYLTPELRHRLQVARDAKTPEDRRLAHEALGQYVARIHRDLDPEDMD